jgi:hypothetical protein
LKDAITRNNEAYTRASSLRLGLTLKVLGTAPHSPAATTAACTLSVFDSYQIDQVSPLLNGLLVNVIAAWRNTVPQETLAEVRDQQQKGWRELHDLLLMGGDAFSLGETHDACAGKGKDQ